MIDASDKAHKLLMVGLSHAVRTVNSRMSPSHSARAPGGNRQPGGGP
jgi:hypothetical protein